MARASCLSEDEALAHVRGLTAERVATDVQDHVDGCAACRVLVAEAARGASADEGATTRDSPPDSPLTLPLGQLVAGRYRIMRFIARGGMGEVYEAQDTALGETVALKTLVSTTLDSAQAMNRFLAEVRLARQVTHPNVCRILELGFHRTTAEGQVRSGEAIPFLTMQYLRGETLHQKIHRDGAIDPARVRLMLEQIVAGLSAIHAAGIVHRDIKPQNIMLLSGPEVRVVLTDFGLARALDRPPGTSTTGPFVVGTHEYMSPEQLEAKPPAPAFDVYALGVVIFEMLTGRHPFTGLTVLQRVLMPTPKPSQLVANLDPVWDQVVAGCLATNPQRRFASVQQIVQALGQPPRRPPRPRRSWGLARRAALAAVLGGPALFLVARIFIWPAPTRPPPRPLHRLIAPGGCSGDMVRVADRFCIDRFEASTVDDVLERPLSPFYPPSAKLAGEVFEAWSGRLKTAPPEGGVLPELPAWQREDSWRPRAVSRRGTIPQGYVSMPLARQACASAGKRLCTPEEWRTACAGEQRTLFPYGAGYVEGACNIARAAHPAVLLYGTTSTELDDPRLNHVGYQGRPLLLSTGAADRCQSRWGTDAVYDMVGNLDEWVDDPAGTFVGGFYSRDSRDGCQASIDRHDADYLNYSLGFRCCDQLRPPGTQTP